MVGIITPNPSRAGSTSPATELKEFMARHPRKSISLRPQPPLCKLPNELIFNIASFLPRSSLFCMGLSCKQLWTTFSESETLPQNPQDKADILNLLEVDYPSHVPCLVCMKLRRRRMTLPEQITSEFIAERPLLQEHQCTESAGAVHICNNFMISFDLVQLVVRSRKFSLAHGIPVEALSHSCNRMTTGISRPHAHDHAVAAKLIDGRLFLRLQYTQIVDFSEEIFAQVRCFSKHGCKHAYIDESLGRLCASSLEKVKGGTSVTEVNEGTASQPPRCLYCASEYEVVVSDVAADKCKLTVNCYRDLGSANSPWSDLWQSQQGTEDSERWPLNWQAYSYTNDSLRNIFNAGVSETAEAKPESDHLFPVLQLLRQERLRDPSWVRFYHGT